MSRPSSLFLSAALVATVVSSPALAQRPGLGNFGRGSVPGKLTIEPGVEQPKVVNPVHLLLENRAALALSDTQFTRVIAIKRQLDSTNAPLLRRIDSVARLFKRGPLFSEQSRERRDSIAEGRALVRELVADVEEHMADAKAQAFGLLSASQLTKAEQIEEKARKPSATQGRGRL